MPDPITQVTAGMSPAVPAAATLITVAGIATGLPSDLIFPGFAGSLWAIKSAQETSIFWRIVQLVVGTLLAAWITHPFLFLVNQLIPVLNPVPPEVLKYPVAFLSGWWGLTRALGWFGERAGVIK